MVTAATETPVLDTLCTHYAHAWTSRGDARWLRHAWQTLATIDEVPAEIPAWGPGAVDARLRLAALARFSDGFNLALDSEDPEPVDITCGPFPVEQSEVLGWMSAQGVQAVFELMAATADPEEELDAPSLDLTDIEFALDEVSDEVLRVLLAMRPPTELFAELSAQRYHTVEEVLGEQDAGDRDEVPGDDEVPLTYPLPPQVMETLLGTAPPHEHALVAWFDHEVRRILSA